MAFISLCITSFRNLSNAKINIAAKEVFLIGKNGQGKTNFLEALYYCSYASSFRGVKDSELVRKGEKSFSAIAELNTLQNNMSCLDRHISIKTENLKKSITLDGKKILDRKNLLKIIPTIIFCHEDMEFVSGSQERRRWFFDQTQSLYDPVYLDDLRKYRRILKTRNTVLKNAKTGRNCLNTVDLLDALDPQLAEYGLRLMEKRDAAVKQFSAVFSPLYEDVSGISGITIKYAPSWKTTKAIQQITDYRTADMTQGITVSGPHRDKYFFLRSDPEGDFSGNASTGQRRLLALLLRVAQARCFTGLTGKTPVLLLDDVLLELDGEKRRRFLSVMPDYEQAFFAFLPEEPYKDYCKPGTLVFQVNSGIITGEKAESI